MCVSYVFAAISTMLASYMQSTGHVKISIAINFLRQLVLLIPLMWLCSKLFGMTGIWWSFIAAELNYRGVELYIIQKISCGDMIEKEFCI